MNFSSEIKKMNQDMEVTEDEKKNHASRPPPENTLATCVSRLNYSILMKDFGQQ